LPVEDVEHERVVVPEGRAHPARVVAAFDAFDLHDFRTQVCQDRARKRAGQHLPKFDHPHARERGCCRCAHLVCLLDGAQSRQPPLICESTRVVFCDNLNGSLKAPRRCA